MDAKDGAVTPVLIKISQLLVPNFDVLVSGWHALCHCLRERKNLRKTGSKRQSHSWWHVLCSAWKKWKTCVKLATKGSTTVEPLMKSSLEKRGGNMMCFCVCVHVFLFVFVFNIHKCTLKLSCLPNCLISISPKFWQIITYIGLLSFYLLHCLKHKSEVLSVSREFGQIFTCISPKTHLFHCLIHESEVISVSPESGQIFYLDLLKLSLLHCMISRVTFSLYHLNVGRLSPVSAQALSPSTLSHLKSEIPWPEFGQIVTYPCSSSLILSTAPSTTVKYSLYHLNFGRLSPMSAQALSHLHYLMHKTEALSYSPELRQTVAYTCSVSYLPHCLMH